MKKKNFEMNLRHTHIPTEQQRPQSQDWCSLGARAEYWTGSPWRAIGLAFRP